MCVCVDILFCTVRRVSNTSHRMQQGSENKPKQSHKKGMWGFFPPFFVSAVVFLSIQNNCVIYHRVLKPGSYLLTFFCPVY